MVPDFSPDMRIYEKALVCCDVFGLKPEPTCEVLLHDKELCGTARPAPGQG